uniref:Uncharacterized protein n=1 Tax=Anguilla anguilla TaxID=7936 RepID=A0A0E9S4I9_ANGAN
MRLCKKCFLKVGTQSSCCFRTKVDVRGLVNLKLMWRRSGEHSQT